MSGFTGGDVRKEPAQDEELRLYNMQVALILAQALQLKSEVGMQEFLLDHLQLHNVGDWSYSVKHPCRYLIALSDGRLELEASGRALTQPLPPTLFLCISAFVPEGVEQHVPPLAMSYSSMQQVKCIDFSEGCQMHGLAHRVAELLPIQTIFGHLGQGYQVVLTGHGFGGLVAQAMAVRILAQLRHEIASAMKLGINLSALQQTQEKVSAFAFSCPLIGNAALSEELDKHGLQSRLHSIWRSHDASPLFFTLCSELATQAAVEQPASSVLPTASCMPFSLDSGQLQLVNKCATVIQSALQATERHKPDRWACAPLQLHTLDRAHSMPPGTASPGSNPDPPLLQVPNSPLSPKAGSGHSPRTSNTSSVRSQLVTCKSTDGSNAIPAKAASSPSKSSTPLRKQLTTGNLPSPSKTTKSASSSGGGGVDELPVKAGALSLSPLKLSGGAAGAACRSPGAHTPRTTLPGTSSKAMDGKASSGAAGGAGPTNGQACQAAIRSLLSAGTGGKPKLYSPVGSCWLLNQQTSGAAPKAGKRRTSVDIRVTLEPVPGKQLLTLASSWLEASDQELLGSWEWGLQELQRDLMEAFAWLTFRPVVSASGQVVSRKHTVRLNKSLLLA